METTIVYWGYIGIGLGFIWVKKMGPYSQRDSRSSAHELLEKSKPCSFLQVIIWQIFSF